MPVTNIKSVINHLCKLLDALFKINIKPEYFRLAKFNTKEENVCLLMWITLQKLLNLDGDVTLDTIKLHLQNLGYKRSQFFHSFHKADYGSRELLIVLGFLLATNLKNFIQNEIDTSVFCETYFKQANPVHIDEYNKPLVIKDPKEHNKYKNWLLGKIAFNKNMHEEYSSQATKIYTKLNKTYNMKATGGLTIFELLALTDCAARDEFLKKANLTLSILKAYCEWLNKEKYFWKWMQSVLEEDGKIESK